MADFGERAAAKFLIRKDAKDYDPLMAMLRAATSGEARPVLHDALERQIIEPLAARLSGEDRTERARLIMSLLSGVGVCMRILGSDDTAERFHGEYNRRLARMLQALVDG